MGDAEFGVRSFLNNYKSINNPKAKRIHLKSNFGGLREMGSWDGMRPTNIFSPRPIPSILYLYRKYWGNKLAIFSLLKDIPLSLNSYKNKGKKKGYIISICILIIFFPIILIQIFRSWKIASSMILSGDKIESYN